MPEERASVSFATNFLLSFRGFASSTSHSDVLSVVWDDGFLHLFTPLIFFSGGGVTSTPEALRFFNPRAMGSGRG
jgi:hypothetical protein